MTKQDSNNAGPNASQDKHQGMDSSRRKWLKKAGVAAPGLLILANRPAFGASCSISGFMSARVGTSLTTHDGTLCNGWSPGNWKINRGQITQRAWNVAGVSRSDLFDSIFNTTKMSTLPVSGGIRKVQDGIPEATYISYSSMFTGYSMQSVLEGMLSGMNQLKDISMHSAAAYLNASFLANGGGGTDPDPWMFGYNYPVDIVGLYLLYELTHQATPPAGCTYRYERGGIVIASSEGMSSNDYATYLVGIANGSASDDWSY
jgi:hypothetical protein